MEDLARAVVLCGLFQAVALALFVPASFVAFRVPRGGVLFYKSTAVAAAWSALVFVAMVWVARGSTIDAWLVSAGTRPIWFAFFNAVIHFCLLDLFLALGPVVIDRSLTMFLLGTMAQESGRLFDTSDLEGLLIRQYVKDYKAVDRRMAEQMAAGNVLVDHGRYRLTRRGALFVKLMKTIAVIFNLDRRFVNPTSSR